MSLLSHLVPFSHLVPALALSTALAALAEPANAQDEPVLDVVASFSVLGDMTSRVGGERVNVSTLVGPGADAHVYEPSPADAARVAEADVVILNGLGFEGFIDRLIEVSGTDAPVIIATVLIDPLEIDERGGKHAQGEHGDEHEDDHANETAEADGHDHDDRDDGRAREASANGHDHHHHGKHDPHAWHSLSNARLYVAAIADGLCAADPDGCETFRLNASNYTSELDALDTELGETIGALPADRRTLIVSHNAFGYLAQAYDMTFLAAQGVSTEAEASAADVARLIDQIREDGAAAVFVENIADPRLIEQIANETNVAIGGTLYSDALSPADGPASTYIDMMRHNAATIASAVAGS